MVDLRFVMRSGSFSQRAYGALLLVFGLIAIITPFSAGGWAISILGLILLLAGVVEVIQGLRTQSPSSTWATYLTGVLMILGGLLLFARPVMVIGGLLALIALLMAADGVTRSSAHSRTSSVRRAGGQFSTASSISCSRC